MEGFLISDCRLQIGYRAIQIRNRPSNNSRSGSRLRLGLAQAGNAITVFPLAAFLEERDTLKAFESISFRAQCAGGAQAAMQCHKLNSPFQLPEPFEQGRCL
jgi:hypothetical protein